MPPHDSLENMKLRMIPYSYPLAWKIDEMQRGLVRKRAKGEDYYYFFLLLFKETNDDS